MASQVLGRIDELLKPTELCDCDNARPKEKADEIIKGAKSPKEGLRDCYKQSEVIREKQVVLVREAETRRLVLCL